MVCCPSSVQLDSDITSCMGGTPRTNRVFFLLLRVIFATLLLFSGFGLKTRDRSELPVSVFRESFKLLNYVRFVFCKSFIKKGSVIKFTNKNSLFVITSVRQQCTYRYKCTTVFFFFFSPFLLMSILYSALWWGII